MRTKNVPIVKVPIVKVPRSDPYHETLYQALSDAGKKKVVSYRAGEIETYGRFQVAFVVFTLPDMTDEEMAAFVSEVDELAWGLSEEGSE